MIKNVNIAIVGLGTVGLGVYKVLVEKKILFKRKLNLNLNVSYVCDINTKLKKEIDLKTTKFVKDYKVILNDKDVDIVVELIGGTTIAKKIIIDSLMNKKNVVTANKALLSEYWQEIYEVSKKNNAGVLFEASVAGAIPVLNAIKNSLTANNIYAIYGIINGTCNYILTSMSKNGLSFNQALKEATEKGYAELDPTFDIEGIDSLHKLTLLILLSFGVFVDKSKILCEGISRVALEDIEHAKELGFEMKLLGIAKLKDGQIEARVHPTLIPEDSVLASVSYEDNAVFVDADLINKMTFHGKGAGRYPTASAVIGDIIEMSKYKLNNNDIISLTYNNFNNQLSLLSDDEIECEYYIKVSVVDKPKVLSNIASILGDNLISISHVIQKPADSKKYVPIILLTHKAVEKNLKNALVKIDKLDCVKRKSIFYRVER